MRVRNLRSDAEHRYMPAVVTSSLLTVLETEPPALVAARARRLEGFWLGLESVLESRSPDSRLNDVVQLSYTAPSLCSGTDNSDSEVSSNVNSNVFTKLLFGSFSFTTTHRLCLCPCLQLQNGTRIFDGIAQLIYKCVRWRQQHHLYREKLKLINVPLVKVQEEVWIMKKKSILEHI